MKGPTPQARHPLWPGALGPTYDLRPAGEQGCRWPRGCFPSISPAHSEMFVRCCALRCRIRVGWHQSSMHFHRSILGRVGERGVGKRGNLEIFAEGMAVNCQCLPGQRQTVRTVLPRHGNQARDEGGMALPTLPRLYQGPKKHRRRIPNHLSPGWRRCQPPITARGQICLSWLGWFVVIGVAVGRLTAGQRRSQRFVRIHAMPWRSRTSFLAKYRFAAFRPRSGTWNLKMVVSNRQ